MYPRGTSDCDRGPSHPALSPALPCFLPGHRKPCRAAGRVSVGCANAVSFYINLYMYSIGSCPICTGMFIKNICLHAANGKN